MKAAWIFRQPWESPCRRGETGKKITMQMVIAFAGSVTKEAAACNKRELMLFSQFLRNVCTLAEAMDPATAKNQYDSHCRAGLPAALSDIMV